MKKTNYSYETSLPPYKQDKTSQCLAVLDCVTEDCNCLLQISRKLKLPQSTISGRVNDLIEMGKVKYEGFTTYENRKRKAIKKIQ
jgi:predicted transcriptional regulator